MKQVYPLIALAALLVGLYFFASNFQVNTSGPGGPQIEPRSGQTSGGISLPPMFGGGSSPASNVPVSVPGSTAGGDFIRISSFNIQVFGEAKLAKREVVEVLAKIVQNFDIVAIQEIRAQSQTVLPTFVAAINSGGARYDYVIGERVGRTMSKEQYAYIYNTDTIEVDRSTLYTVSDPDDLLHREPLVAWFRCKAAEPGHAFTFSLVNIHVDPDEVEQEVNVLDDVLRAVRNDGRDEDDVILLGDFNTQAREMGQLGRVTNATFVVQGNMATNVRGNAQYDNIVFDLAATQEFLGRGGTFDFLRQYNLSLKQAEMVSDHIPVWAEFSVYEGGVPGRVAARPNAYSPPAYLAPRDAYTEPQPQYTADPRYPTPRSTRPTSRW
jgi:endonuclease/exonuclease/phosphatase family metal-dependent hydrolase